MSATMNAAQQPHEPGEPPQHPQPPTFRRFDEALYWLHDHGWRQVGASRGSHFRLEHPAYSKALFLIYKRGTAWGPFQQLQLVKHLRKLDANYRRPEGSG